VTATGTSKAGALAKIARLGFFDGAAAPFRGLGFVIGTPSVWPWAAIPSIVLIAIASGVGWGGVALAQHVTAAWVASASGWVVAGGWVLRVVLWLTAVALGLVIGLGLAQPLSGPALDKIVEAQERALGRPPHPPQPLLASALRALRTSLVSIALTLTAVIGLSLIELAAPPAALVTTPLKFLISALVIAWDLIDYPLGLRGRGVRDRFAWIKANLGPAMGFGVSLAIVFMIPCAGFLLLPAGVAGATRLVIDDEERTKRLVAGGGARPPWLPPP
jgi:CysZ protein